MTLRIRVNRRFRLKIVLHPDGTITITLEPI